VTPACVVCGQASQVVLEGEAEVTGYRRWQSGELISRALPMLTLDQRELLMTGIHPACWAQAMPDDEG
jgi:hypothetical protein